jgi:phosphate transport system protein
MGTRQVFAEELAALHQEILRMGVMVEEALRRAVESLVRKDGELARAVVAGDAAINRMEQEIEERCVVLIAREQPVATDLRKLVTSLKIVTQLERMGDHALHVAKGTLRLLPETYMKPLIDIPRMAELGIGMIRDVLTAFLDNDAERAREVAQRDQQIDELHNAVQHEVFTAIAGNPGLISQAISLLFISRFLERIGDHVTNICEWVVYSATGERVELNV